MHETEGGSWPTLYGSLIPILTPTARPIYRSTLPFRLIHTEDGECSVRRIHHTMRINAESRYTVNLNAAMITGTCTDWNLTFFYQIYALTFQIYYLF
jgi:hypothetical protein